MNHPYVNHFHSFLIYFFIFQDARSRSINSSTSQSRKYRFRKFRSINGIITNLAGVCKYVRKRILKEDGFTNIEQYLFEEHPMLQRAATECMCNLVIQEEVWREKFDFY